MVLKISILSHFDSLIFDFDNFVFKFFNLNQFGPISIEPSKWLIEW